MRRCHCHRDPIWLVWQFGNEEDHWGPSFWPSVCCVAVSDLKIERQVRHGTIQPSEEPYPNPYRRMAHRRSGDVHVLTCAAAAARFFISEDKVSSWLFLLLLLHQVPKQVHLLSTQLANILVRQQSIDKLHVLQLARAILVVLTEQGLKDNFRHAPVAGKARLLRV